MSLLLPPLPLNRRTNQRANFLREQFMRTIAIQADHLFGALMALQWSAAIALAIWLSPRAWEGLDSHIHPHVWAAVFLGGAIASLPILLAISKPGERLTRYVIACAQLLFSALLIHLSGGRIETHFHIFGSLAFLSFYRDWRVLIPATIVVAVDHALRGTFWPQSVFGVPDASHWRWIEHAGWVIFEDIFLVWACVRGAAEIAMLAARQAELETVNERVEAEVEAKTEQLHSVTQELISSARRAGMAEIATGVLHNVGNALNSVNVSASMAIRTVKNSEIPTLLRAGEMLRDHQSDLAAFLINDDRGKQLPEFFIELAQCIGNEQSSLISELRVVEAGLDHIKQIVGAQQQHAKNGTLCQRLAPGAVFEQAIAMDAAADPGDRTIIVRKFESISPAALDKHKILQILINLLKNARKAVSNHPEGQRRIVTSISTTEADNERCVEFSVSDNGVGIAPERLKQIFSHGYTTRSDGHGFGLHSAVNAAREMGGDVRVYSAGENAGAVFTLSIPLSDISDAERILARKE